MAHPPAVVIIARHGARLDAADKDWILSTPTPYDPPLTYAGWNQSRALGVRIASLLHAREEAANGSSGDSTERASNGSRKRKRRTHKVVIHSSPFLRCLQTSVAISAGMAQFEPVSEPVSEVANGGEGSNGHPRAVSSMHSASPKMRAMEATRKSTPPSIVLTPIVEPKQDLVNKNAAHALASSPPHRKSKLRVDAFLGEWMNPQYFDYITPPPPSNMMVAGAKAELMQNEALDVFTPSNGSKGISGNLWGGMVRNKSRESLLDDWSDVRDSLPAPRPRRDRASSHASYNSADSADRRSPFRSGHVLQPLTSSLPKQKEGPRVYVPPTPAYAVSGSDHIPRGYLAHARAATVDIDYQWDSSRPPQSWGDGAELGEEWSAMHKRFRRGLNSMVRWYGRHGADARAEDALGLEQVEGQHEEEDEEQEELVVILVTHGAGCNALIGALTGQPVLIDVATSSLTTARLRDDAPPLPTSGSGTPVPATATVDASPRHSPQPPSFDTPASIPRRNSLEASLAPYYQMQITASTDHLRSGASPARLSSLPTSRSITPNPSSCRPLSGTGTPLNPTWQVLPDYKMGTQSAALGSIRRPPPTSAPLARPPLRSSTLPGSGADHETGQPGLFAPTPPLMHLSGSSTPTSTGLWTPPLTGLWTPPAARTPVLAAKRDVETSAEAKSSLFSKLEQTAEGRRSAGDDMVLDFSNSPPDSRPTSSHGTEKEVGKAVKGIDGVVEAAS
ncbi:hypothetical protein LTR95_013535 [Oleoguttula sp. CCFEE 5521]